MGSQCNPTDASTIAISNIPKQAQTQETIQLPQISIKREVK